MALNIALSSFYFGYCIVYFGQVKIEAIKEIFAFDVDLSIAKGLLNGCIPVGALFGALSSSILLAKFSRRYQTIYLETVSFSLTSAPSLSEGSSSFKIFTPSCSLDYARDS